MIRVRCLLLRPDILAERVAREGGSTRSAFLKMCAFVSEEPSAGRHHCSIALCRRETATAEALQTTFTNRAQAPFCWHLGGFLFARSHVDVHTIQKRQYQPTYISPFTRSKGIVWRAAPNAFLGERGPSFMLLANRLVVNCAFEC